MPEERDPTSTPRRRTPRDADANANPTPDAPAETPTGAPFVASEAAGARTTASATEDGVSSHSSDAAAAVVIDKGKGDRPARAPKPAAPVAEPVEVSEDIDFAALMAGGGRGRDQTFEPGAKVRGIVEVVSLHGEEIFLDLGGKATGYVLKEELRDADGNLSIKPGDEIEGVVAGVNDNGVHIRTRLGGEAADTRALEEAHANGLPVDGKVDGLNKGGYDVIVGGQRAFCPHSQIEVYRLEDPESVLGKTFTFKITEIRPGSIVVSRAAILREEQAVRAAETMHKIKVGAKLKGHVRSIQKFGAFVDLGGIDGLVHVSELSWDRVDDPHHVVKLGQEVEVVITEIDPKRERLALSMKQAQGDPWETAIGGLSVGQVVSGAVVRLTAFGAFVTIAPGVDGLVHVSDLAHHRVRHPGEVLKVGDQVDVKVTDVDLGRRRIALSLKALAADPWDDIAQRYAPNQEVEGRVESVQVFGVFVTLEPGVTALLPASESNTGGKPLETSFRVGDTVQARILRVEPDERKIAVTRKDEADRSARPAQGDRDRGGPRRGPPRDRGDHGDRGDRGGRSGTTLAYSDVPDKPGKSDKQLGSLGELLLKALKKDGE